MKKIEFRNITRTFENQGEVFVALDNLSFSLCEGEILSLVGPNGAGKTTTIKILSNYLYPTSGEIYIGDKQVQSVGLEKLNIGVVFGGEQGFYNNVSAIDNLMFFGKLKKLRGKVLKDDVESALKKVSLYDVKDKHVGKFSRGMKQRLHIARALLGSPDYILLDEPTIGLDVEIAHEIRKLVLELKKENKAILLTSHKMDEIEKLADKIVVIGAGKEFFSGTTSEFVKFVNETMNCNFTDLEEAYLQYCDMLKR